MEKKLLKDFQNTGNEREDLFMKYFFAMSALEESIDRQATAILYAEEGCQKKTLDLSKYEILNNQYKTFEDTREAFNIVESAKENMIDILVPQLNAFHGTNISRKGWERILYFWLDYYIEAMYQKYIIVKQATQEYNIYTNVLSEESFMHPYYKNGFFRWCLGNDIYNFQLYSHVADFLGVEVKEKISIFPKNQYYNLKKINSPRIFNKKKINTLVINPVHFGLNRRDQMDLYIRSLGKIKFYDWNNEYIEDEADIRNLEYDKEKRSRLILEGKQNFSEFEKLLLYSIPLDIPTVYVEAFNTILRKYKAINCINNLFSVEDFSYYDTCSILLGTKVDKLFNFLLGGDGNLNWGRNEAYLESKISDVMHTSGWKDKEMECEIRKWSNCRFLKCVKKRKKVRKQYDVLYCGTANYSYRFLMSAAQGVFPKEYIDNTIDLLDSINKADLQCKARLFPFKTGWNVEEKILNRNANILIDDGSELFVDEIHKCKLCIVDSISTPWIEAILSDVPILIYIPKKFENFSGEGYKIIEQLRMSNILFDSLEVLLEYVVKNINCIEDWWNEPQRQQVIHEIKSQYGYCNKNYKKEIKKEMLTVARESR